MHIPKHGAAGRPGTGVTRACGRDDSTRALTEPNYPAPLPGLRRPPELPAAVTRA